MKNIEKVYKEFKKILQGEIYNDEITKILYSTAACNYKVKPDLIIIPKNKIDILKTVKLAKEENISITARGAASSLCGQAVNKGIILDCSKYLKKIIDLNLNENYVEVQPGINLTALNKFLKPYNKFFAPDPSSTDYCTLGGMVANNSGGAHSLKYGKLADNLISLNFVNNEGEEIYFAEQNLKNLKFNSNWEKNIHQKIINLILQNENLIAEKTPQVNKNSSGYNLKDCLKDEKINLAKLLAGSEGTLGIITSVKLKIIDLPKNKGMLTLHFKTLEDAAMAVTKILKFNPSMIEIVDKPLLQLVEKSGKLGKYLSSDAEAILLVEVDGNNLNKITFSLQEIKKELQDLIVKSYLATDEKECADMFEVRKSAVGFLNKIKGSFKPINFIEDATLPLEKVPLYLRQIYEIFKKYKVLATSYGHAGNGNIHVEPFLNLRDKNDLKKYQQIADEVNDIVFNLGGSLSGEHGDGILNAPYLPKMFGDLYKVFQDIKKTFDPQNIFNPQRKILIDNDEVSITDNLRFGYDYKFVATNTALDNLKSEIESCHGCGSCRNYCPIFFATGDEKASARAKANIMKDVLIGKTKQNILWTKEFKKVMDLCVNCQLCLVKCPSEINIPAIAREARTVYLQKNKQEFRNILLQNTNLSLKLGSMLAPLSNIITRFSLTKKLNEKFLNLSAKRNFPKFSQSNFFKNFKSDTPKDLSKTIIYFPGCFSAYCDAQGEPQAVYNFLKKLNYNVILLPQLRCCGAPKLTLGNKKSAIEDIKYNLKILNKYLQPGIKIVASQSTCVLMLKEYSHLLPTKTTKLLAENTFEIHQFIFSLIKENKIKFNKTNLRVGFHIPCHLRVQKLENFPFEIFDFAGLKAAPLSNNCCGMAGTFGFKKEYYKLSQKIGEEMFANAKNFDVLSTSCATCKMQLEQGTNRQSYHPVEILMWML